MKKISFVLILFGVFLNSHSQNSDRSYLSHGHNFGTAYTYGVSEIIIHPDSTFTWKTWNVGTKKNWKNYEKFQPSIKQGQVVKNGKFYSLIEHQNNSKTDINWVTKISNNKIQFYFLENNRLKLGVKYKRQ